MGLSPWVNFFRQQWVETQSNPSRVGINVSRLSCTCRFDHWSVCRSWIGCSDGAGASLICPALRWSLQIPGPGLARRCCPLRAFTLSETSADSSAESVCCFWQFRWIVTCLGCWQSQKCCFDSQNQWRRALLLSDWTWRTFSGHYWCLWSPVGLHWFPKACSLNFWRSCVLLSRQFLTAIVCLTPSVSLSWIN